MGNDGFDAATVHPQEWYDEQRIDLRTGTTATAIDTGAHTVTTDAGDVGYAKLLLVTGASPRSLDLAEGTPAVYLRNREDSDRIKAALTPGRRVVIIGGGWIGLEVAAAARTAGAEVIVLEAAPKPLLRVLGDEVADVFAGLHTSHGVDLRTGVSVTGISQTGDVCTVHLGDGSDVEADLLVVGVGVQPNTALAEGAGLATDNGILVDEHLVTSDPDVLAAGDVANAFHPTLARRLRVEHWDNAIAQGRTAAANMMGAAEAYDRLPYFFTDQYDLGSEYVGNVGPEGYDEVVLRGDVPGLHFTAFWIRGGRVVAGMHVNDWDAIDPIRAIVGRGAVDLDKLRQDDVSLSDLA
jgi:3-phenylpropionate/trans-cinnamate dioxygenase ferredoxin reductase subunit